MQPVRGHRLAPWATAPSQVLRILLCLLSVWPSEAQDLRKKAQSAKKKGLKGYDLVDKMDVWYGSHDPPFGGPDQVLDTLGDGDGRVTKKDWKKAELPEAHFAHFDKNSDGILDTHEAMAWWLQRKPARDMDLGELAPERQPKGHMKKLGAWKDPLPNEGLIYQKPYPHPREFWKKHMDGYRPALLKGAQHGWPAMGWTREVLSERFGWVDAKLEPKVEGRGNDTAYVDLVELSKDHRLNISDYLRLEKGKNVYVVSIIPQVMAWEVAHPSMLLCGSRSIMANKRSKPPYKLGKHEYPHESGHEWMTHLFEANLWMASGRTRSQLHYDKEWNVNCLLSGRKRWFFLNPFDYDKDLQWVRGKKFQATDPLNNRWTDWIFLDPDNVDLVVQNKLRNMDYYEMIQEPGDCIFIPYAMLHQVEKLDDDLQVAVSWMFLPEAVYDEKACQVAPVHKDLPLAAMDTLFLYTGRGIIPQGYDDPLNFVNKVQGTMEDNKEEHLSLKTFTEMVSRGDAALGRGKNKKKRVKAIYDLISKYADEPSKGLRRSELRKVPLRLWCKPATEGDEEGPLPCDHGQEYHLFDDEDYKKMDAYVQESLVEAAAARAAEGLAPEAEPEQTEAAPQRLWSAGWHTKQRKDEL